MIRKLFALLLLVILVGAGLYVWKLRPVALPSSVSAVGDTLDDVRIAASVKTALSLSKDLERLPIEVSVSQGEVRLTGRVPSEELRQRSTVIAEAVSDVRSVTNKLVVADMEAPQAVGRSMGESLDDHAIGVRVKLALSLRRELTGTDISVRAFRRKVTLAGEVASREQRSLAERVASETSGVLSVESSLRLRGPGSKDPGDAGASAEKAVRENRSLSAYRLSVTEEDGRLILRGQVRTAAERDLAGLLAATSAGMSVDNNVTISGSPR